MSTLETEPAPARKEPDKWDRYLTGGLTALNGLGAIFNFAAGNIVGGLASLAMVGGWGSWFAANENGTQPAATGLRAIGSTLLSPAFLVAAVASTTPLGMAFNLVAAGVTTVLAVKDGLEYMRMRSASASGETPETKKDEPTPGGP